MLTEIKGYLSLRIYRGITGEMWFGVGVGEIKTRVVQKGH